MARMTPAEATAVNVMFGYLAPGPATASPGDPVPRDPREPGAQPAPVRRQRGLGARAVADRLRGRGPQPAVGPVTQLVRRGDGAERRGHAIVQPASSPCICPTTPQPPGISASAAEIIASSWSAPSRPWAARSADGADCRGSGREVDGGEGERARSGRGRGQRGGAHDTPNSIVETGFSNSLTRRDTCSSQIPALGSTTSAE